MSKKKSKRQIRPAHKRTSPDASASAAQSSAPSAGAARTAPAAKPRSVDKLLVLAVVLSAAGALLAGYLTITKLTGNAPAMCGAGGGCDVVQSSRWAEFLGLPVALWGMLTYVIAGLLAWRARKRPGAWRVALFVAFGGVALSVYLTLVSLVEIGATCGYCLTSLAIITALFVVLLAARPQGNHAPAFDGKVWFASSGLVVASGILAAHLYWSGFMDASVGPEKPYLKAVAVHLQESGARFYGASWCPACQRQKQLFEASAGRLPFVECTPAGRGTPLSTTCQAAGVENFPTWVIDGKRYVGVLGADRLASLSGYKGPSGPGS